MEPKVTKLGELYRSPLITIVIVTSLAFFSAQLNWFSAFDRLFYDFLIKHHTSAYPDDIVLVSVDEASLESLGGWPWDRYQHAALLTKLKQADAVAFDIIFSEPQSERFFQNDIHSSGLSSDRLFANEIERRGNVVLPVYVEQHFSGYAREMLPIPILSESASAMGHVNVDFDSDGIVRSVIGAVGLGAPFWPHLSVAVLRVQGLEPGMDESVPAAESLSPHSLNKAGVQYIRFVGPANSIFSFSYADVLAGMVPEKAFANKTVFVGATAKGLGDYISTPLGILAGVEYQANVYHALKTQGVINFVDVSHHKLLIAALTLVICVVLSRVSPTAFLVSSFAVVLSALLIVAAVFYFWSLWFPPASFVVAVAVFYPLWSWRRIRIALTFLRQELALLKVRADVSAVEIERVEKNLDEMVEAGLLVSSRVELVCEREKNINYLWPDTLVDGDRVFSVVKLDKQYFSLALESPVSFEHAKQILTSLLFEQKTQPMSFLHNSYELVERTIDEIGRIKEAANRAQAQMNQGMMHLQDAVLVADPAGKILFCNESSKALFSKNLKPGDLVMSVQDQLGTLIWNSLLRRVMLDQQPVYQEIESSNAHQLLCQAAPIKSEAQNNTIFVFTDVTQLRRLERGKNEALAFLSHDMRSPIVSQLALIQRIEKYGDTEGCIDRAELLPTLAAFAEKSLKYAEDFLQLAKAENLDEKSFQLVDMHGVVDAAHANVVNQASLAGIALVTQRTASDCWVLGDGQLLERAVTNLLLNAIQYSGDCKTVKLTLKLESQVLVEISDGGPGIDKHLLPNLFEPYFRARAKKHVEQLNVGLDKNRVESKNYGLGLSFVHSVVMRHGGEIDVKSVLGKGTKFILSLPDTEPA